MKESYVLLGGWSRDHSTFLKFVETAPHRNNVYVIPHTFLIPEIKIPSIDIINKRILEELKKQNLTKITLMGHSLGGALAISFAANYPKYIKKLILIDSEGIPDKRNFSVVISIWVKDNFFINGPAKAKKNVKAIIRIIKNFPYYIVTARFSKNIDVRKDAEKIKIPTLILWGEKDKVVPIGSAKEINRLIKGSRLVVLDGMDHDWLIHNPQLLWNNIEK